MKLDLFTRAYLECALWASTYEDGEPLDTFHDLGDFAPEALAQAAEDCQAFQRDNAADLADVDLEQAGHDFFLTRNGHGAGFWDRGLRAKGKRLTEACRPYGSADAYEGDDNLVYFS